MKNIRKFFVLLLKVFSTFYIVVLGLMYFGQRNLQYHPDTHFIGQAPNSNWEQVTFKTIDGINLNNWYAKPSSPNADIVVFFHGNSGNISSRPHKLERFIKKGMGVLMVEYRGFGGNAGDISEEGFYNDARAALQWLRGVKEISEERFILYGTSLGTGVAVQMATENHSAKALILEAPYKSIVSVAEQKYPYLPVNLLLWDRYDNEAKINSTNQMPLFIFHGTNDRVVPYDEGLYLYKLSTSPNKQMKTIQNAGHNGLYKEPTTEVELFKFLHSLDILLD